MKKVTILLLLSVFGLFQALAQDYPWGWCEEDYLEIAREGVKWLNEKVIINHGDTTCHYYIYEFSGKDSVGSNPMSGPIDNALYYYTGKNLDTEQDSLIAGLSDHYPSPFEVSFFRNHAYDAVAAEERNMIELPWYSNGGTTSLYWFLTYDGWNLIDLFLMYQESSHYYGKEKFLTRENLIEVDSLIIEGINCSRYAYIGEDGEPLAYIVEGIGFDSRNMGDLLTPFTREPDPDADYQEYCGLCHVVKDGQIIYKGMRYTPDNMTGIDEVVADQRPRQFDDNYYHLMGQPVGKALPTTPGIYIHHGKKICVSRTP